MNRVLSPLSNTRGRLLKLKKGLKPVKLRIEPKLPSLKALGNTFHSKKKSTKVRNVKLMDLKSNKFVTKQNKSTFPANRANKSKTRLRMNETLINSDNSTKDCSKQFEPIELMKWEYILCKTILKMNQKVQNARESRFRGFFSPQ